EPCDLLGHGANHIGMAVPDAGDGDPAQEVQVLVALVVPQPRALPPHELHGRARVRGHHELALERLELGKGHARILVPMPASVNSSSSSEWGTRPSMMWALVTPPSSAVTHASSLGRMPPETSGRRALTS